ncbi:hypothetical protein GCM10012280_35060 [Wenjunlia tyrosinilytica]|uniref:Uncharacterized protein n=1 Tax=Wenjunlia tyrosinilytica TaxID=1544741 RepID=A0A917ZRU4_9ACTN|nr:hypothetical protein GCM10012280_35060 [Wenjunlia tyrosinilytica]
MVEIHRCIVRGHSVTDPSDPSDPSNPSDLVDPPAPVDLVDLVDLTCSSPSHLGGAARPGLAVKHAGPGTSVPGPASW